MLPLAKAILVKDLAVKQSRNLSGRSLNLTPARPETHAEPLQVANNNFNLFSSTTSFPENDDTANMILRTLGLLAALLTIAFADVEFTSPKAGSSESGLSLKISWKDSGDEPKISELATYQMFLCAGGNDEGTYVCVRWRHDQHRTNGEQIQLATLVQQGDFAEGDSTTVTLTAGLGADVKNAYFIKVMSAATGGVVQNFSPRFSLTGMTGIFPPSVTAGLKSVDGTKGPDTINQVSSPQVGANPAAAGGPAQYNVPYTMQTAQVRYAPMPPMAPSKITAKGRNPAFPTSAYTVYQTEAGLPNAITTETLIQTFSVVSREATVCSLNPYQDFANFDRWLLNRNQLPWKNSSTDGKTDSGICAFRALRVHNEHVQHHWRFWTVP